MVDVIPNLRVQVWCAEIIGHKEALKMLSN